MSSIRTAPPPRAPRRNSAGAPPPSVVDLRPAAPASTVGTTRSDAALAATSASTSTPTVTAPRLTARPRRDGTSAHRERTDRSSEVRHRRPPSHTAPGPEPAEAAHRVDVPSAARDDHALATLYAFATDSYTATDFTASDLFDHVEELPDAPASATEPARLTRDDRVPLRFAIGDTAALVKRDLLHLVREPGLLIFTFVQPVLFVALFRYVFGGTLGRVIGMDYVDYLLPGIFVQAVTLGAVSTAIGLAEDFGGGIIDRFRSLPMVRLSVLAARTLADLLRNAGIIVVMLAVGMAIGFRPHSVVGVIQASLLVLAFAYALSWLMALVGLRATSAEEAQSVAFPLLLPITFASSAFVPVATMPGWLQFFAEHQPVTIVVNACRGLMLGSDAAQALHASGSFTTDTTGYVLRALAWTAVILVIAVPRATRAFDRT